MLQRLSTFFLALTVLFLSACVTQTPMAFKDDAQRITAASKPIFLMTATLGNDYRPSYQPGLRRVYVDRAGSKEGTDRIYFTPDEKTGYAAQDGKPSNNYLLRFELAPGDYVIHGMHAMTFSFPFTGNFLLPLHIPLTSRDGGVYYLGHVQAVVRERVGEEFRAGPVIPLIDQAVAGASGGTFEIAVSDRQEADEAAFRARFPALQGVMVKKAILPAFDRAKAQEWWQAH